MMDPTATLSIIRVLIKQIEDTDGNAYVQLADVADELAEHVKALDQWISNGGFLPVQWEPRK